MELIIVVVIILIFCLVLNVNINYIMFGFLALVGMFFALLTIGFTFCLVRLLLSKPKEAEFVKFDKAQKGKYKVAYYLIDGEEYPCMFPKEFIMENKLYSTEKTYKVMLNMRTKKVFDRYAIITCVLGLIFSVCFCVGLILFFQL